MSTVLNQANNKVLTSHPNLGKILISTLFAQSMTTPIDPLAIVPEDYPLILSQSFGSACGLTALLLVLEREEDKTQVEIKEKMMKAWKGMWVENFQKSLSIYMTTLEEVSNNEELPQPEEYQLGFNRALAAAEKSARISLGLEVEK